MRALDSIDDCGGGGGASHPRSPHHRPAHSHQLTHAMAAPGPKKAATDDMIFCASKVTIVATRVDGDIENPGYVLKVETPSGDVWPCLRRWTACKELHKSLMVDENPALKGVPFPGEKIYNRTVADFGAVGSMLAKGATAATAAAASAGMELPARLADAPAPAPAQAASASQQRKQQLEVWLNEVIQLCPGETEVLTFLADDNSVSTAQARELGVDVVSSNPTRKMSAETAPDNKVGEQEHVQRLKRQNKQLMDSLDSLATRATVSVAPVPQDDSSSDNDEGDSPQPQAQSDFTAKISSGFGFLRKGFAQAQAAVEKGVREVAAAAAADDSDKHNSRWKAYYIQCFNQQQDSWYIRRSVSDLYQLRNRLLKDGNPAVRGTPFPSKIQDTLRPNWADDSIEDAVERREAIEYVSSHVT